MNLKLKMPIKILLKISNNEEMFGYSNYTTKPKYCDNSIKLVVGKMKYETVGVAIQEFIGLKPNMYLHLVDDNSEHKMAKGMNKNVVATINHN